MDKYILVVEDDKEDEELILFALNPPLHPPYKTVVLHDGAEALEFLAQRASGGRGVGSLPYVILLDLNIPKVDGLEVLQRIRSNKDMQCVPVVVFTTSMHPADISRSYQFGANSYINKPMEFNQFAQAVREIARYWLNHNQALPNEYNAGPATAPSSGPEHEFAGRWPAAHPG